MEWKDAKVELPEHQEKVLIYIGDYRIAICDRVAGCFRSHDQHGNRDYSFQEKIQIYWSRLSAPMN